LEDRLSGEVLLLDDDFDVREAVAELVEILTGRDCVAVESFAAMVALAPRALGCEIALLDIELGTNNRTGIDAYRWLLAQGFAGRIYFISAHSPSDTLVNEAQRLAVVVKKPIDNDELRRIVASR
jgi:DNA-binding NtrC family response regulator